MKLPKVVTIDFETQGIKARPKYPPEPLGVSIKYPGKPGKYYAFGHVSENNSTKEEAIEALKKAYTFGDGVLFHNSKFDVDVADIKMGCPVPDWSRIHDTLFLIFLDDPHRKDLGLKPVSEELLDMPPEERDEVGEWLLTHQPVEGVKISKSRKSDHYYMKYLEYAPAGIVGKYANSDTDKTEQLFNMLWTDIEERDMLEAYDRERRLMPVLLDMERRGVCVDHKKLKADVKTFENCMKLADSWIIDTLSASTDINLNSSAELMGAMIAAGKVDEDNLVLTPTGKVATNKDALLVAVNDKQLLGMLNYRAQLGTCLQTFMKPWLAMADASEGKIFCTFNQVRSSESGGLTGARTGRLSSQPNLLNLPKKFKPIWQHEERNPVKAEKLPVTPIKGVHILPKCRGYILPFPGEVLIGRDVSGQEIRILAHFEDGAMLDMFIENPAVDLHQWVKEAIYEIANIDISRYAAKQIAFSIIYGSGASALAAGLDVTVAMAKSIKDAYYRLLPGIKSLIEGIKSRSKRGEPIRTIGGREYFCEPPKMIDGRKVDFTYKLLNYLIQGSSADQTKEATIQFTNKETSGKIILLVHDEIVVSVPREDVKQVMSELRHIIHTAVPVDSPMGSDGEIGTNWGGMRKYFEPQY